MLNFLFNLFIFPIYGIIEFLYHSVYVLSSHYPLICIFAVSFFVNLICLPMYNRAEFYQKQEREIRKKLEPTVKSINRNFKGDERFMLLSTYYRQNHYHPIMSLRSSLSLLIQIPFFIAAYAFFSQPQIYGGVSVGILKSLSKPDGLINIFGFSVNFLPILMTIINVIAAEIYAKGIPVKERVQMHVLALVFLILLYNSPAGLVIYWTFNNCFSLLKNIGLKTKNTKKFFAFSSATIMSAICFPLLFNSLFVQNIPSEVKFGYITLLVLTLIVLMVFAKFKDKIVSFLDKKNNFGIFLISAISMFLLLGIFIPSSVISSSPEEFSFLGNVNNPVSYIFLCGIKAFGVFCIWGLIFYYFFDLKVKNLMTVGFLAVLFSSLANVLMFRGELGLLTVDLTMNIYDASIFKAVPTVINSVLSLIAMALAIFLFVKNKYEIIRKSLAVILLSVFSVSSFNLFLINRKFSDVKANVNSQKMFFKKNKYKSVKPLFELSRSGKNVIIIFTDRAISAYLPVILNESPNLQKSFSGFTFYPNCVSYFGHTILAYPSLIGGYEYIPENINKIKNKKISETFKESLLVLPLIFKQNGYISTVLNAPINLFCPFKNENDGFFTDDLYDKYGIKNAGRMNTGDAEIMPFSVSLQKTDFSEILKRNFLCFSIFVTVPTIFKKTIYANGAYLPNDDVKKDIIWDEFLENEFLKLYSLPDFTGITDKKINTFTIFNTECIHLNFNDKPYCNEHLSLERQVIKLLGLYADYLKSNGVYDNTRIIIVSDHGHWGQNHSNLNSKMTMFNPLLFVKDFGKQGKYTTDNEFMTNADTPQIALKGLVKNPVNPFTGKNIFSQTDKKNVKILYYKDFDVVLRMYSGDKCYYPSAKIITVSKDIFNPINWHFEE